PSVITPAMPPRMPVATPMAAHTSRVRVLRRAAEDTGQGYAMAMHRGPRRGRVGKVRSALAGQADLHVVERMLLEVAGDERAVRRDHGGGARGSRKRLGCQRLGQAAALEGVVDLGVHEPELVVAAVELGEAGERAVDVDLVARSLVVAGDGDVWHCSSF